MNVVLVLAALVALATVLGLVWKSRQGRVTTATGEAADLAAPGANITLLQLSTTVCAPCAATHSVLQRAAERSGVAHVDLDITDRPDVAKRFNVLQTPTTLILGANGDVLARIGGAVRPATVSQQLDRLLPRRVS